VDDRKSSINKFSTARNQILGYRVHQMDMYNQKEILAEGYDDGEEEGAGEKLLGLLQKMDIGSILVIVCIWNSGVQLGESRIKGGELYRIVNERAKELLLSIKQSIVIAN
jgi:putative IMPACT (imprinted ancient) family translation regulator